jgi:hypothetical protein
MHPTPYFFLLFDTDIFFDDQLALTFQAWTFDELGSYQV